MLFSCPLVGGQGNFEKPLAITVTLIYNKGNLNYRRCDLDKVKRGRPTDNPKPYRIAVKMDAETRAILTRYCEEKDVNQMEAARRGIRKLADELEN